MLQLRAIITLLIVICILYFIIGGIIVLFGWLSIEKYAIAGGVVGGIASVLGLISLARPVLNQHDLDSLESDSLRSLAETSEKIKVLEKARAEKEEEIDTLQLQKQEMELLVQKASLSLFLREQRRLYEKRIQDQIADHKDLVSHIAELISIDQKLASLNEEIETDPNVDLVKEIIASAQRPPDEISEMFENFSPFFRTLFRLILRLKKQVAISLTVLLGGKSSWQEFIRLLTIGDDAAWRDQRDGKART